MERKYEFTDETKENGGCVLHRIRAVRAFADVYPGELGGWIETEENLSHRDACWIAGEARVYNNARVYGNAQVRGEAQVRGNAQVYGEAWVYGAAHVFGDARVSGNAVICGEARIQSLADYACVRNFWSSGRSVTYTRSDGMWTVGCFHGTGDELIKKAYADSKRKGRCYETIIRAVEKCANELAEGEA